MVSFSWAVRNSNKIACDIRIKERCECAHNYLSEILFFRGDQRFDSENSEYCEIHPGGMRIFGSIC